MFSMESASLEYLNLGYIVTNMDHEVLIINYAARQLLLETKTITTLEEVVDKLPDQLKVLDHVKYCSVEHKSCSFREVAVGDRIIRIFLSPIFDGPDLKGNLLTLEDITDSVNQRHARDQFLAYLVHEFRTPLTAIHGNSSLVKNFYKPLMKDEDFGQIIEDIDTGSNYMLQMVNQFLDMSRLEEGRITYALQELDAVQIIQETTDGLKVLANDRELTLELHTPENLEAHVVGDAGRVKQVLTNLIGNGLKFTEKGGVTVTLALTDKTLQVRVSDTGPGIPAESRPQMFQKYFQASNNKLKGDSTKSTGLGLYVTRLIMDGMGGHIELIDTPVGEGSTFMFTLDLATPERLKRLEKQIYDEKQGVQHSQVEEHTSVSLAAQKA